MGGNGWLPIETAPKDGTKILVFTVHDEIELTEWYEIWWDKYIERPDGLFEKVPTLSGSGWNGNTPTCWQPLPAPPAARGDQPDSDPPVSATFEA